MVNNVYTHQNEGFLTPTELGEILGVSRITIHKRIKKGEIPVQRIGRNYIIPKSFLDGIDEKHIDDREKEFINRAVKRTVKQYGEALRLLGKE